MINTFRMKVVSKRQITLPQQLLDLLRIHEGDFLEFIAADDGNVKVNGLKLAPTQYFSSAVLSKLDEREADIEQGKHDPEVRDLSKLAARRGVLKTRNARHGSD